MENLLKKFIKTEKGQEALKHYKVTTKISPQNIYVDGTDVVQRYIEEHKLLINCLLFFQNRGIDVKKIIMQIPEIEIYYPFIRDYDFINAESFNFKKNTFYKVLKDNIVQFYSVINPRQYGEYYTYLEVINAALKNVKININDKVIDPSCGSGFILYGYLQKLIKKYKKTISPEDILESIQNNIFGCDVFPSAVIMTKLLLGDCYINSFGYFDNVFLFKNVKVMNTLSTLKCKTNTANILPQFDLVIGNPPFFRIDPKSVDNVCSCTQHGHHYAHSLFLHWTLQYTNSNGIFCLILPESMLTGNYYQKARQELVEKASIKNIIINKQYEKSFEVQQDVMILIGQKSKMENYYYTTAFDLNNRCFEKFKLPSSIFDNKYNVIPVITNKNDLTVLNKLSKHEIINELDDFEFSTGSFVWNQNKERCFMHNGKNRKPLISGPSIVDGEIIIEHNRKNTFMYCEPDKPYYIMKEKAIVFRRMSPMEREKRFMGAIVYPEKIAEYVVENHVNIIKRKNSSDIEKMYDFLCSDDFNTILKMFCRTNQVSVSDLSIIFEILFKIRKV